MSAPFSQSRILARNIETLNDLKVRIASSRPKRNKFNARKTIYDGIRFDSAKECERYKQLMLLLRANKIGELERQPKFELHAGTPKHRVVIGSYKADFAYIDRETGEKIYEDVKSTATAKIALFRWKLKHVQAEHGVKIRLVF